MHKVKYIVFICAIVSGLGGCQTTSQKSEALVLQDANNFAKLLENNRIPSAQTLQSQYIDIGTGGIKIFTNDRIENADKLAREVSANIDDYRHAIAVCLPVARTLSKETSRVLDRVADLLGESKSAPTYVLFGANNSGGTANEEGLAIGLEVACKGATKESFERTFIGLVAHEVTHVYQARSFDKNAKIDLLYAAIGEGGADFVAKLAIGVSTNNNENEKYGKAHENEIWQDFKADLAAGVFENNDWFYRPGRNGRPKDLGYYIGRRICEEYYARATDKKRALRDLIEMRDTRKILAESHFDELQR